ncbi:MAG: hypothetical protein IT406_00730 [Candidatus Yanofskybacteria bacterium]|nr:hypothetical protein [Candidatus Yanofskybacteria bacterium]
MSSSITKNAIGNAVATAAYVVLIALFFSHAERIFGPEDPKTFLIPTVMLLLLVLSAAITGFLVFGRPVMWYIDGRKKEAIILLGQTLASLAVILLLAFTVLYVVAVK